MPRSDARQKKFNRTGVQQLKHTFPPNPSNGGITGDTSGSKQIALFVEKCISHVESKGITTPGIYRIPANMNQLKAIREKYLKGEDINFNDGNFEVSTVASVLKSYLRDLPDSIIPQSSYFDIAACLKTCNLDTAYKPETLKRLIQSISKPNYDILKTVIVHLKKVSLNSDKNMMNTFNLSVVFGPTMLRSPLDSDKSHIPDYTTQIFLVETLINHVDEIFSE